MIIHHKQKRGLDLVTSFFLVLEVEERKNGMECEATLEEEWLVIEINQGLAPKLKLST